MKDARYPVTLSPDLLQKMLEVSELLGRLEGIQLVRPVPKLREKNRAGSVRGSTGIEGNRCTLAQVEAIACGEPVAASKKDVLEVRNALAAYGELRDYDPYSVDSLLHAHARLMGGGLMLGAGHFRREAVEVYVSEDQTREMPPWKSVEPSMRALFDYLKNGDDPLLLKSVRFHFECVNVHPFVSGHSKPASDGHLKTSHLDEAVRPVEWTPKGDRFCNGEPDQDGNECFDHRTVRARLVPAAHSA